MWISIGLIFIMACLGVAAFIMVLTRKNCHSSYQYQLENLDQPDKPKCGDKCKTNLDCPEDCSFCYSGTPGSDENMVCRPMPKDVKLVDMGITPYKKIGEETNTSTCCETNYAVDGKCAKCEKDEDCPYDNYVCRDGACINDSMICRTGGTSFIMPSNMDMDVEAKSIRISRDWAKKNSDICKNIKSDNCGCTTFNAKLVDPDQNDMNIGNYSVSCIGY